MKFEKDSKYARIAFYSFLLLASTILFYLVVSKFTTVLAFAKSFFKILMPITIGLVMAYLFNFFLVLYEKRVLSRFELKHNTKRFIGIVLTYLSVFLLLALFLKFIFPQLMESLTGIINDIPHYVRSVTDFINNLSDTLNLDEQFDALLSGKIEEFIAYLVTLSTGLVPMIANLGLTIISSIWNIVIGLIVSVYLLADKERFVAMAKKTTYALLPKDAADKTLQLCSLADNIFGNFISGKILDSAIIGVLTFAVLSVFKIPYALLIAFIIGITNIIPFFGPFIGAIPAFFIIVFVSVNKAFIFLILIFIIQQIDGNFIGPKILGDSLGISAFWILFSLLIAGKLFGFLGMIIGVPAFVFIYTIVKGLLEAKLKKKNLPFETDDYR